MNRKGQALVEFVLILPIFILILFSIVDFGMILSKKSELENISVDIILMINNDDYVYNIENVYPDLSVNIEKSSKYTTVKIEEDVDIITPGLNLIFGDPYKVKVERTIPNV